MRPSASVRCCLQRPAPRGQTQKPRSFPGQAVSIPVLVVVSPPFFLTKLHSPKQLPNNFFRVGIPQRYNSVRHGAARHGEANPGLSQHIRSELVVFGTQEGGESHPLLVLLILTLPMAGQRGEPILRYSSVSFYLPPFLQSGRLCSSHKRPLDMLRCNWLRYPSSKV